MGLSYDDLVGEIVSNYENHNGGDYNCLPFEGYGSFCDALPGIERSCYYILTASSGIGKSKLMRHMFISNALRCRSRHKVTIKYFSLEESKKKVVYSEIISELYRRFGVRIGYKQLLSIGSGNRFDIALLDMVKECRGYIEDYLSSVEVIDTLKKPGEIYRNVRDFACGVGTHYTQGGLPMRREDVDAMYRGDLSAYGLFSHYRLNDPNHYVIILIDHLSLLQSERGYDKRSSMELFSSQFCIPLRDRYGFSVVVVQQQAADRESGEKNNEPTLEGLGDCKTTQRDADVILGLYNPSRYGLSEHNGIVFGNQAHRYRSVRLLKNRNGDVGTSYPFRFYGETGHFESWYNDLS